MNFTEDRSKATKVISINRDYPFLMPSKELVELKLKGKLNERDFECFYVNELCRTIRNSSTFREFLNSNETFFISEETDEKVVMPEFSRSSNGIEEEFNNNSVIFMKDFTKRFCDEVYPCMRESLINHSAVLCKYGTDRSLYAS